MKSTSDITLEIEGLRKQLRDLLGVYADASEGEQPGLSVKGNILKRRIKALKIALEMREHKGKRVSV